MSSLFVNLQIRLLFTLRLAHVMGIYIRKIIASRLIKWVGAELVDLRRKFAEDKQRIAELKAARKFKPY